MGVNPISSGPPHVHPTGRTCGEPDEIKKNTHPKYVTALFFRAGTTRTARPPPRPSWLHRCVAEGRGAPRTFVFVWMGVWLSCIRARVRVRVRVSVRVGRTHRGPLRPSGVWPSATTKPSQGSHLNRTICLMFTAQASAAFYDDPEDPTNDPTGGEEFGFI